MHIFFSGIGGTAIGPLALIARQTGHTVTGSDKQDSNYIKYLRQNGITNIGIGQSREFIQAAHARRPIDWYVYSSAVIMENPDALELMFCAAQNIKTSKRDELLNRIIKDKQLKLIAIAGTHGKTTTTAMAIWLFKQLGAPVSYSVGAKIPFGDMGQYQAGSEYFVLECDEFDRNFLSYEPWLSLIAGVSWDHHEIFPTREDYQQAFRDFIGQSKRTLMWPEDVTYLGLDPANVKVLASGDQTTGAITLTGHYNRLDAWLAVSGVREATRAPLARLIALINRFPGLQRRMEEIAPGLYSDYAHTPEKIRGALSVALEQADGRRVFVVYEPLTNRRQHYLARDYKDCFAGAAGVYWLPSYLAREDPAQRILPPAELISYLSDPSMAKPRKRDGHLARTIREHLANGDVVVAMAGGGGGSLDEWLRARFGHA